MRAILALCCGLAAAVALADDVQGTLSHLAQDIDGQQARVIAARAALLHATAVESAGAGSAQARAFAAQHPEFAGRLADVQSMSLRASGVDPDSEGDLHAKVSALEQAERTLTELRAKYFSLLESHRAEWSPTELEALVRRGLPEYAPSPALGPLGQHFREPAALDFGDHEGFVSIFDGRTLQGWEGDPAVWRVEGGAIVGRSDWRRPVSSTYLSYHGGKVRDFDLKLEIRVEGRGGSGIQYRSRVGVPRHGALPQGMPNTPPQWMMTGPQADFWPYLPIFSGQLYSENTPLGIIAWRGQVVDSVPGRRPRLVAVIGDRTELGNAVKINDWNQYEIIARGAVTLHIINGQLMAVAIDDDPTSSSNAPGLIGIEIELVPCRVSVRNVWLRQLR